MNKPLVYILYHADCTDGFGAAWAAWQKYGDDAVYIPVKHGEEPPDVPAEAQVFLLDFSYPRKTLLKLQKKVASLIVLDHHATAAANLKGLAFARFDMTKSGAVLAWEYFVGPGVPTILKYVQDRDLWLFRLPASKPVSKSLQYAARKDKSGFLAWQAIASDLEEDFNSRSFQSYVERGDFIMMLEEYHILNLCNNAATMKIGDYDVPAVNSPVFQSEIGEYLLSLHPESPFAAVYYNCSDGTTKWSLRSRRDFDCSKVAELYGGGGHPQSCGFQTKTPTLVKEKKSRAKTAPVESD